MARVFRVAVFLVCVMTVASRADFADGLLIYPAGSLSGTFTEMVKVFPAPPGLWRRRSDTAQRCNRASSVPQHLDRSGFYQRQDWLPG